MFTISLFSSVLIGQADHRIGLTSSGVWGPGVGEHNVSWNLLYRQNFPSGMVLESSVHALFDNTGEHDLESGINSLIAYTVDMTDKWYFHPGLVIGNTKNCWIAGASVDIAIEDGIYGFALRIQHQWFIDGGWYPFTSIGISKYFMVKRGIL